MPKTAPGTAPRLSFAARVIRWRQRHGRTGLPWLDERDPYRVWLSEAMLQQTQAASAAAFYLRFLESLPDVRALAAAPLNRVMVLWSGLGYYARARNLHHAAQIIVQQGWPQTRQGWEALPGVGRSTAAAICALAYGQCEAIWDANARRLITRHRALSAAARGSEHFALAQSLLPKRGGEAMRRYTQGVMDLGATVCCARSPQCAICPLASDCRSRRRLAIAGALPTAKKSRPKPERASYLLLLSAPGAVWLEQRAPNAVWGALLCPPLFDSPAALRRAWRESGAEADNPLRALDPIRHSLTHFDWHLQAFAAQSPARQALKLSGQWFDCDSGAAGLPLPAPIKRLLLEVSGNSSPAGR